MAPRTRREVNRLSVNAVSLAAMSSLRIIKAAAPPPYLDSYAYAVYSVILLDLEEFARAEPVVIAASTETSGLCSEPVNNVSPKLAPAIANHRRLSKKQWRLQPEFKVPKPYTLISKHELDEYFEEGGTSWTGFYNKYPKSRGYYSLSPVGFNLAKDLAVVSASHICGALCTSIHASVLEQHQGKWKQILWRGVTCDIIW